jgi:hypothetical protein
MTKFPRIKLLSAVIGIFSLGLLAGCVSDETVPDPAIKASADKQREAQQPGGGGQPTPGQPGQPMPGQQGGQ